MMTFLSIYLASDFFLRHHCFCAILKVERRVLVSAVETDGFSNRILSARDFVV